MEELEVPYHADQAEHAEGGVGRVNEDERPAENEAEELNLNLQVDEGPHLRQG